MGPQFCPIKASWTGALISPSRGPASQATSPDLPSTPDSELQALSWPLSFPLPSFLLLSLHRVSLLPLSPALDATCIGTQSLLLSQGLSLRRCFTQPSTLEPELVSMSYDPGSQLVKTTPRRQCQQPSNLPDSLTTVPQPLTPPVLLPSLKAWMSWIDSWLHPTANTSLLKLAQQLLPTSDVFLGMYSLEFHLHQLPRFLFPAHTPFTQT